MRVLSRHRAEHAEGGGDGVAAAFDGQLHDVLAVEVDGVLGEAGAGGMFDALIDGKDGDVPGAGEAAVVEDRLEVAQHGRRAIGDRHDPIHEIRSGEMKLLGWKTFGLVAQKVFRIRAEQVDDLFGGVGGHEKSS